MKGRTLVFVPTYNERENVEAVWGRVAALGLDIDVLFLDDNSPDGTGEILDKLARKYSNITVIHRPRKLGIGSAHLAGIRWAYDHQYATLITMDCDFSHRPEDIPSFLKMGENHDVIVGSRFLGRESLSEWNLFRKTLTLLGHFLTRYCLNLRYDATGAYRLYRLDRIPREVFYLVDSQGYSFFFESLYVLHVNGFSIKEVPITLPARTYGHSKMSVNEALKSVWRLVEISFAGMGTVRRKTIATPVAAGGEGSKMESANPWDDYWKDQEGTAARLYSRVAAFYREMIIKPSLNHFVKKHLAARSQVLHAGCGSGQVDTDICHKMSVTALDISRNALDVYRKTTNGCCQIVRGDVCRLPFKNEALHGIYNLGVMEHFTEDEIARILSEFNRVLKPNGKLIIFWPPEFGLTVFVLKIVHRILNSISGSPVRLHPDEFTRLKSRKHAETIFKKGEFCIEEYYFGVRDLFTQAVIVARKNAVLSVCSLNGPLREENRPRFGDRRLGRIGFITSGR